MSILGLYADRYDDDDSGACYSCFMTWLPGEGERHKPGCYRIENPAGRREPGTCYECGAREFPNGACTNEGGCRRWSDFPGEEEWPNAEPIPYGELVAAAAELHDLPF